MDRTFIVTPSEFRRAREAAGLTQEQCAELVHCRTRSITHWEAGTRPVNPTHYELLLRKANLYKTLGEFLDLARRTQEVAP